MRTAENHSQGQAAENLNQQAGENRNAWLKDEMERGENMAGLIALIAIIFSIINIINMFRD